MQLAVFVDYDGTITDLDTVAVSPSAVNCTDPDVAVLPPVQRSAGDMQAALTASVWATGMNGELPPP
jgi:hypothetical protein